MSQRLLRGRGRRTGRRKLTLKKVNRKVNRILRRTEKKLFNFAAADNLSTTGVVEWLTAVNPGDSLINREGSFINATEIRVKYNFAFAAASSHHFEHCRIMIFIDKEATNAKPTVAEVIAPITIDGYLNTSSGNRFRVLYDKVHVLNRLSVLAVDTATNQVDKTFRLREMQMGYNTNTLVQATGVGSEKNQLFVLLVTNAASDGADFCLNTMLKFVDQ